MRIKLALLASLFGVTCMAQESTLAPILIDFSVAGKPVKLSHSVDLAKPGALDRLEKENPDHYAKVLKVQRAAMAPSCVDELRVLKADLKLDHATCAEMTTLTSFPPKRTVSVMIDGVHYMTFAPIEFQPAKPVPLLHESR